MPPYSAGSTGYLKAALDGYHSGVTLKCQLLTGTSVTPDPANTFASLSADVAAGVTAVTVTATTSVDTSGTNDRVETAFSDATFTVPTGSSDIVGVVYYVDTANHILHHGPLSSAVVIPTGGATVIIRAGSDGVSWGEVLVTDHGA